MLPIGERIKMYRKEKNLTQEELANILSVSRSAVSNWEIGRNYPDLDCIVLLSDILQISLDHLLKGDDVMVKQIAHEQKSNRSNKRIIIYLSILSLLFVLITGTILYQTTDFNQFISPKKVANVEISKENQNEWTQIMFDQKENTAGYLEYHSLLNVKQMNYPSTSDHSQNQAATIRITQVDKGKEIGRYDISSKDDPASIELHDLKRNTEYLVEISGDEGTYNVWFVN